MKDLSMLEEFQKDLEHLTAIMEADDTKVFNAPGPSVDPSNAGKPEEAPAWQKELDADTVMNDCDAKDCFFFNEGFKGNCRLAQIDLDENHSCKHYKPKSTESKLRK